MFSIVSALERAGVLRRVAIKMLAVAKTPDRLLMAFVVGMGLLAAFLVNDTIALLGVPLVIYVARHAGIRPVVLLIALAFGITVGSVMTPIGNPQNLLIAIQSGIAMPFTTFLVQLAAPTIANLFVTYAILKVYYRKEIGSNYQLSAIELTEKADGMYNPRLAKISIAVLIATIAGFVVSEVLHFLGIADFSRGHLCAEQPAEGDCKERRLLCAGILWRHVCSHVGALVVRRGVAFVHELHPDP
jgi:Na+/H+ antiporter NhaD/arsenite permease-like protein